MLRLRRTWVALGVVAAAVLVGVTPAYAGGSFQECLDQAANHNGEPPTCTEVNGAWVASWPDDGSPGGGIPGGFIFLMLLGAAIAVVVTVWKGRTAQRLAKQSGLDPDLATQMTLLTDNGLDSTYLAASLRRPPAGAVAPSAQPSPVSGPAPVSRSAAARLEELGALRDQGLVTQAEYDEQRKAIIETV